jgi:hypothetical protein
MCHSERSEESLHLKAQSPRKNAGILRFAQNDRGSPFPLSMTNNPYQVSGKNRGQGLGSAHYGEEVWYTRGARGFVYSQV